MKSEYLVVFDLTKVYFNQAYFYFYLVVCEAIRRGIESVVPPIVLNLLSWYQLEEMVCGKPIIDINLLRVSCI